MKLWVVSAFVLGLSACSDDGRDFERQTERIVRSHLKDPDSAEFRRVDGRCGIVNAKNSFGAYTGVRRFVVLSDYDVLFDSELSSEPEKQLFGDLCKKALPSTAEAQTQVFEIGRAHV